MLVKLILNFV
jgi:hypothetical protein